MFVKKRLNILVVLLLVLSLLAVGCGQKQAPSVTVDEQNYARPEMLVDVEELKGLVDDPNVAILDIRTPAKYVLGHVPNAINVWRPDYEAPEADYGFGGMLCDKARWEELLGSLGIDNDTRVIIYDDNGVYDSGRVWWAFFGYGHENVQILNGGWDAWVATGGEKSLKNPSITPTTYTAKDFNMDIYATLDEVKAAVDDDKVVIIDTRAKSEYDGEELKSGAFRKGRIPGSIWIEWNQNLNEDKTVKSAEELREMYKEFGIDKDTKIIVYCQSGVRSAASWFNLRLIGYDNVQNYDGSWIEWSFHGDLPIE
ncbi:sulfurtransferase [Desulfitibacter alkalitolerans]|uniref:sulfurtransferase n=1 Tax=Desulfitibacter alkalitolerans TaxID=264641 RepID=UPI0005557CC8|nr:sulfurtransferase [Desulfitibacter alkalitolerans]